MNTLLQNRHRSVLLLLMLCLFLALMLRCTNLDRPRVASANDALNPAEEYIFQNLMSGDVDIIDNPNVKDLELPWLVSPTCIVTSSDSSTDDFNAYWRHITVTCIDLTQNDKRARELYRQGAVAIFKQLGFKPNLYDVRMNAYDIFMQNGLFPLVLKQARETWAQGKAIPTTVPEQYALLDPLADRNESGIVGTGKIPVDAPGGLVFRWCDKKIVAMRTTEESYSYYDAYQWLKYNDPVFKTDYDKVKGPYTERAAALTPSRRVLTTFNQELKEVLISAKIYERIQKEAARRNNTAQVKNFTFTHSAEGGKK